MSSINTFPKRLIGLTIISLSISRPLWNWQFIALLTTLLFVKLIYLCFCSWFILYLPLLLYLVYSKTLFFTLLVHFASLFFIMPNFSNSLMIWNCFYAFFHFNCELLQQDFNNLVTCGKSFGIFLNIPKWSVFFFSRSRFLIGYSLFQFLNLLIIMKCRIFINFLIISVQTTDYSNIYTTYIIFENTANIK